MKETQSQKIERLEGRITDLEVEVNGIDFGLNDPDGCVQVITETMRRMEWDATTQRMWMRFLTFICGAVIGGIVTYILLNT